MLILLFTIWIQEFELEQTQKFEPPKAGFEQPTAVCGVNPIFVLDRGLAKVFVYDPQGKRNNQFGETGRGEGQFIFAPQHSALMASSKDRVWVWDGSMGRVQEFDFAGHFVKAWEPDLNGAQVLAMQAFKADQLIFLVRRMDSQNRQFEAIWTWESGKRIIIVEKQVQLWRNEGGHAISYAFPANLECDVAADGQTVLYGLGSETNITLWQEGSTLKKSFNVPKTPISDEDREEYLSQSLSLDHGNLDASWPDFKPYFNRLLALPNDEFLIFNQSPVYGAVEGYVLKSDGKVAGKLSAFVDEAGRLISDRGRLYLISPNGGGRFEVTEVRIRK